MIIAQHRSLSALNIFLVIAVGTILCLGAYLHLPENLTPIFFEPALGNLIGQGVGYGLSPQLNVLITLFLTLLQAFQLNGIVNHHNFLGKPNFLTALLFMTLVSAFVPFLVLSPTLICNFLTIWMLGKLFKIYKQPDVKGIMFDLGLIVAVGSLVYFPFIAMLALLWISLLIFRAFYWREWLTPLLGVLTVYFLLGVVYYWLGRLGEFYDIFAPLAYPFPTALDVHYYDYLVLIPVFLAVFLFLDVLRTQYFKSIVHVRKSFKLLFYMLLIVAASFYMNGRVTINHFLLSVPPLSIYLAYYFTYAKRKWVYETLYLLIVSFILYFQYW